MEQNNISTEKERNEIRSLFESIYNAIKDSFKPEEKEKLSLYINVALENNRIPRDIFGFNPILFALNTAQIAIKEIGLKRDAVIAILTFNSVINKFSTIENIQKTFGESVFTIVKGLLRLHDLYKKTPVVESENFRNLLISFAEDMRVILLMIADRVNMMRQLRDTNKEEERKRAAEEANYLYAPLAHKLGLYKLKSELEDLSLKYLEHDAYYMIKENLNATKKTRDAYISNFIAPIKEKLENAGLKFQIKGRTKSIHSIWQKMKKQQCGFSGIYDLFAIRIIIDSLEQQEKMQCWQAYSIITDMYQPNPKRLRDWLSVPKSNGYESLHITVLGPENRWVEVQIRTERMDEIAEHGLAAHWRYKGVKSESGIDEWLGNIRAALEHNDDLQLMDQFKLDLYEDEVYVFSPKGDLYKLVKGATVLDFAFHIHSGLGCKCVGAKINNRNVSIKEVLHSGDQVEIITQSNQKPNRDWLKIVKTSRAKSKIRLALKETQAKTGLYAKEMLERRFKNRKIDIDESVMSHLVKKMGFKEMSDFFKQIADEKLDLNEVVDKYLEVRDYYMNANPTQPARSAEEFNFDNPNEEKIKESDDILIIDKNLKGIEFSLAKCCHPIYGDDVFGFVTINGGIKIHRCDCPNSVELRRRFGYRIVKARWSGKGTSQYSTIMRIIGNDDIAIINNITSIISKEEKITLRSINIESHDGLFTGNLTLLLQDTIKLDSLIKKIKTIKGIKQVCRL